MQKYLTPHDIASNVIMMRALHKGGILITEGATDSRFISRFTNSVSCLVTPAHNKDNAVGAMCILDKLGMEGVLAVVDSDYWRLDGTPSPSPNILLTDTHDVETMILSSPALERILGEFGDSGKLSAFRSVKDSLLGCAIPIGILRWISSPHKDKLNLKFEGLIFDKFINKNTLTIDLDIFIREVKVNSNNTGFEENSVKAKISSLRKEGHDPWHLCCGHDLVEILFVGLANSFGNYKFNGISLEAFNGILRLSYDYSHFRNTALFQSLSTREKIDRRYRFLA